MSCSDSEVEGVKLGSSPTSIRKPGFFEKVKNLLSPSRDTRQLNEIDYESASTIKVGGTADSNFEITAFQSKGLPRTPPPQSKSVDEKKGQVKFRI
jgi:hypothetical protein